MLHFRLHTQAFVQNMQNGSSNGAAQASGGSSKPAKQGQIEKMYQKKSQLEHILLRPDTYIGSVERITDTMWVCEKREVEEGQDPSYKLVQREVSYVPGLYKIFDEILVNAAGELIELPFQHFINLY